MAIASVWLVGAGEMTMGSSSAARAGMAVRQSIMPPKNRAVKRVFFILICSFSRGAGRVSFIAFTGVDARGRKNVPVFGEKFFVYEW